MGVRVEHHPYLPRGRWGEYRHGRKVIRLLSCLAPVQYRSTLAHELGHAAHGHRRTTSRTELEADVWAARHLIEPQQWWHVVGAYDDVLTVASELGVVPELVRVYAEHLACHPAVRSQQFRFPPLGG